MDDFRLRQVHLDFHTSPLIPGVGEKFNKEEWKNTLIKGHVDSITVFSKCHHGYSFHPTDVNEMHPNLKFDLLKAQLDACKEINVKAPVYISAGYDEKDAIVHHDWLLKNKENIYDEPDFSRPYYHLMCLNTPYLDKLIAEIDEVMVKYNPCEIFLDILDERVCYCESCRKGMEKEGIDWQNDEKAVKEYGKKVYRNYLDRVYETVKKHNKETHIFHNSSHVHKGRRDLTDTEEHLEIESLPTGGWGYDHFPMSAAYARTLREHFLGMTGKFHQSWGEFGGFKHPNALRYEMALSIAMGGGCSIGDQMHPEGKLNESTFELIGKAYSEIEKLEPWCKGAKYVADIAVLSVEPLCENWWDDNSKSDLGANRILLETNRLYDFIDFETDFSPYKLLIIPDAHIFDKGLKNKVNEYLKNGGKLILSGTSGLDENREFCVDTGVKFTGENEFNPTYLIPDYPAVNGKTEYLVRANSYLFENIDADVVSYGQNPYFNRTAEHFCSHQHAPNNRENTFPTSVIKGNVAYIGWDIFKAYAKSGDFHLKELVVYIMNCLMNGEYSVESSVPDRGVTTLLQKDGMKIVNLLFAHTTVRGENTEVIEDVVPIYDVKVSVKCDKPESVFSVQDNKEIPFTYENGRVYFVVPKVYIHQMTVIK